MRMKKMIFIILGGALTLIMLIYGISLYDRLSLPNRLIATMHDVVVSSDTFTKSKLIEQNQDGPTNLNGDNGIYGIFQLSKSDVKTLLAAGSLLKCPDRKACTLTNSDGNPTQAHPYYTATADVPGGALYSLSINTSNNQARWSVSWY